MKQLGTNQQEKTVGRYKIIILGDSHARGYAQEVQRSLGHDYLVQGLVKPGVSAESIVNTLSADTGDLTKKDIRIVWGGTRDIGRNEIRKGLQ